MANQPPRVPVRIMKPSGIVTRGEIDRRAAAAKAATDAEMLELPSYQDLFLKWALYRKHDFKKSHVGWYNSLRKGDFQFDAYCVECGMNAPFKAVPPSYQTAEWQEWPLKDVPFYVQLKCQRHGHSYSYYFDLRSGTLQKVGQLPSMEDIAFSDIEKYRNVLGKAYFSELHRAGGLASYGIGIGSFVYLRRIFERLIYQHKEEFDPDETKLPQFSGLRMEEKVSALRTVLPAAVVKNKAAYSILSKGLHELSEAECVKHFPIVRAAIILMLEQDYLEAEKARYEQELEREIELAASSLQSAPHARAQDGQ